MTSVKQTLVAARKLIEESRTDRFTLVFEGDVRKIIGNPFHIETQYGKPIAVACGDALREADIAREAIDRAISESE